MTELIQVSSLEDTPGEHGGKGQKGSAWERRELPRLPSHTNIELLQVESIFSKPLQARAEACMTELINSESTRSVDSGHSSFQS